ncbi:DISEASE RESISTANCE PROTEIN TAO1-LIKE [Salix koriyanagi]|uniref:DISEASE RESISTANCE PROTEIN TAO1-LIKE n=1 Tax=Salix koriyanagi TaxID=2511006 RepID=A0A9Q0T5V6_9ROSI|nr:DISEASE RESISTANCE PROTEIN TAO1-LIKE [Salix koriyanagi]
MLRNLDVDGCKELIGRSTIQFSSLNTVALSCISDFSFLTESFMQGLAEVKILKITGCQELTNFWQDGVRLLQHLRSLRYLKIKSCSRLVSLGPEEEGQDLKLGLPCSLEMLKLINCESLQRPLVLHGFRSLEELHIEKCAGLVFFVQTTLPCTLKKLCISYCENLQCLLEDGKGSNISSTSLLECLDIRNCPSLKCLSSTGKLPSPLRQLVIWDCPELGSVADTFCNLSLEKLEIKYCGKLVCLPEGLNMLSHLQEITICNCSNIVSLPEGGFPATSLKKLYIGWCEKLQALPERLRGLTSLVELDIHTCPSIVSFPRDGFPRNLTSLLITNLNFCKPLFDWGLHRLASLTRLFITAGCAHILSFPCEETGMMLPTSLSSLSIVNFPNLQYLSSNGFQNLTSLQELWISDCPMLKSLPENGLAFLAFGAIHPWLPSSKKQVQKGYRERVFQNSTNPLCVY